MFLFPLLFILEIILSDKNKSKNYSEQRKETFALYRLLMELIF